MIQMVAKEAATQGCERGYIVQSAHAVPAETNGVGKLVLICVVHVELLKGQVWVRNKFAVLSCKSKETPPAQKRR